MRVESAVDADDVAAARARIRYPSSHQGRAKKTDYRHIEAGLATRPNITMRWLRLYLCCITLRISSTRC